MDYESLLKPPKSQVLKSGRVKLKPGEEVGEHVTDKREEILVILNGSATVHKQNKKISLKKGQAYFIEENIKHNVVNNSNEILEYIYIVSLFD